MNGHELFDAITIGGSAIIIAIMFYAARQACKYMHVKNERKDSRRKKPASS